MKQETKVRGVVLAGKRLREYEKLRTLVVCGWYEQWLSLTRVNG